MPRDDRNLLEVLKFELSFLEADGHGRSPREPWRAKLTLEDSPTCMNYDAKQHRQPCGECVLMHWYRRANVPRKPRVGTFH
jgi:hypothetical protein